jgi:hypothetical protein
MPIQPRIAFVALSALITAAGCGIDEEEDGIDDGFLGDGKADAFGIAEGSPDALGVAIINHRQGGDRRDGTADDDLIDSLVELDAIPYVGPTAFRLLVDHARAGGFVPSADPFDAKFCGVDSFLTMGQVRGAVGTEPAVAIQTSLAGVRVRTRTCVTPDNCPAWAQGTQPNMFTLEGAQSSTSINIPATGLDAQLAVSIVPDGRPVLQMSSMVRVGDSSAATGLLALQCYPGQTVTDDAAIPFAGCNYLLDDKVLNVNGTDEGSSILVGQHCAQMVIRHTENVGATHYEIVYYARY